MQCYLCSNTNEIEITQYPKKYKDITLTAKFEELAVEFVTSNKPIIFNGFALFANSKYAITEEDTITIDNMAYRLKFMKAGRHAKNFKSDGSPPKRFKADSSTKITSFFHETASSKLDIITPFNKITGKWEDLNDLMVFTSDDAKPSSKIAAFDIDGTIIKPKSGKKYPVNNTDWMILYKSIAQILLKYYEKNFKLVLFSNQLPLGSDKAKRQEFQQKVEDILNEIKLPMQVFIATQKNLMRKPCIGMWIALTDRNANSIDKTESFYVGDAAGRPKMGNTPKDHSFSDILFARNVQIKFYTPEEFFMNAKHVTVSIPFDPKEKVSQIKFCLGTESEIIVMVGAPASGKSSFCKKELIPNGYVYVNRDTLGSWQKCISMTSIALQAKKMVVIDNTNKDKESRKRYIDLAKKFKVPCRCFYMNVDKVRAMHNNKYRELVNTNDKHVTVTDIIIHSHYKSFEAPIIEEGFDEIVKLNCVPTFNDDEYKHQELYEMFLLEKY